MIKFGVTGDIIPSDSPLMCGQGVLSKSHEKWDDIFLELRNKVKDFDFLVANFESVLVPAIPRISPGEAAMKSPVSVVDALKKCKIKYLSVANNHTMEYGPDAFLWMSDFLKKQGLITFGHREDPCVYAEYEGKKIGFFAFSSVPAMYGYTPLYYYVKYGDKKDESKLLKDIAVCKNLCDKLLIVPHWGNEFLTKPSKWQISLAEKMLDSGADGIVGMHPHIVQDSCYINGKPVFFSIGNLLSDYFQKEFKKNLFVEITVDKDYDLSCRGEYFSCTGDFKILALNDEFSFVEELEHISDENYRIMANAARKKMRRQMILHLLKTWYVWGLNTGFISWIFRRACFLFKNRKKINQDPNSVYNGPIH